MALVVTLSLLVLVTIAVMAFFARATANRAIESSRANQILSSQLSETARDYVATRMLADLTNHASAITKSGVTVYQVTNAAGMLPRRLLAQTTMTNDTNFSNLVRQSVAAADPASSGDNSATAAKNGRAVTASRWNAPFLNFGPGFSQTNQLPCWIYVNRDGSVTNAASTNAIGRFAYNVYETGGLLDVSVAGHPGLGGTNLQAVKGTLAGADISLIPGIGSSGATNYVSWRNPGLTGSSYAAAVTNAATNGFLNFSPKALVSRRDLIRLATTGSGGLTTNALPYLTHFSREVNAPSWSPTTNATGAAFQYKDNADAPASINRNLPGVRVQAAFTRADGTEAMVGEPLIKTRFALSKLSGVGIAGPIAPATDASIQRDFGLVWDTSERLWNYAGASGSTPQTAIKTLAEVASENREPNFFELLKAVILSGSVGQSAGDTFSSRAAFDASADAHILQIGANALTQVQPLGIPVAIKHDFSGVPTRFETIAGSGNLPYLNNLTETENAWSKWTPDAYSPHYDYGTAPAPTGGSWQGTDFAARTSPGKRGMLLSVWNPYRTAGLAPGTSDLRLTGQGTYEIGAMLKIHCGIQNGSYGFTSMATPPVSFNTSISLNTPSFSQWNYPAILSNLIASGGDTFDGTAEALRFGGYAPTRRIDPASGSYSTQSLSRFAGFSCGDASFAGDPSAYGNQVATGPNGTSRIGNLWWGATPAPYAKPYGTANPATRPSYVLEYRPTPSAPWLPYQRLEITSPDSLGILGCWPIDGSLSWSDPRTLRFGGAGGMRLSASGEEALSPSNDNPGLNRVYNPVKPMRLPGKNGFLARAAMESRQFADFTLDHGYATCWQSPGLVSGSNVTFQNERSFNKSGYLASNKLPNLFDNTLFFPAALAANQSNSLSRYTDRDGVRRLGDYGLIVGAAADGSAGLGTANPFDSPDLRPTLLMRAMRTAADMGYVFRDLPWKSLDFFTSDSADAGLLDVFAAAESPVAAGKVNINSAPKAVLEALLVGTDRVEALPAGATALAAPSSAVSAQPAISAAEAAEIADALYDSLHGASGELMLNKAELPSRLAGQAVSQAFPAHKAGREAPLRAMAEAVQTRTWNLLVDVIAQTGRQTPGGFLVEGERRVWQHIAIDRFTGKITAQQTEIIDE